MLSILVGVQSRLSTFSMRSGVGSHGWSRISSVLIISTLITNFPASAQKASPTAPVPGQSTPADSTDAKSKDQQPAKPAPPPPPTVTAVTEVDTDAATAGRIASILSGVSIKGVSQVFASGEGKLIFLLDQGGVPGCEVTQNPAGAGHPAPRGGASGSSGDKSPAGRKSNSGRTAPQNGVPVPHTGNEGAGSSSNNNAPTNANAGADAVPPVGRTPSASTQKQQCDHAFVQLKENLRNIVSSLSHLSTTTAIVNLPDGAKGSDVSTNLVGKVPGIYSATPLGDSNLLVVYDKKIPEAESFVAGMNRALPLQRYVQGNVRRLYYTDGDTAGKAIAQAVNDMYPDVSAAFVSPDMIRLSRTKVSGGVPPPDTDNIRDAERMIARLDQPRPRASLDTWAIQLASNESQKLELVIPRIEQLTSAYNEVMRKSILSGWQTLISHSDLDPSFKDYIANVSVSSDSLCCGTGATQETAFANIGKDQSPLYALGYQTMFEPTTPNLIDMLINLIGQRNPYYAGNQVINSIEGLLAPEHVGGMVKAVQQQRAHARMRDTTSLLPMPDERDLSAVKSVGTVPSEKDADGGLSKMLCRQRDAEIYRAFADRQHFIEGKWRLANCTSETCEKNPGIVVPPNLVLSCVRSELLGHLFNVEEVAEDGEIPVTTSSFGQIRAAITDFLYQYKLLVQYPDGFDPYREPLAADTLDMALLPVVDAFYDDLGAYQEAMQNEIYRLLKSNGVSYSASGVVSMKMIASNQGIADTISQNSFPLPQPVQAADVVAAVAKVKTDPLGGAADLMKALQPPSVTAFLGKELSLTSTVHSLSGASGMELELSVKSAENGGPKLVQMGSTTSTDDLNSRVTMHSVQTKVRVDNLKLFEIATMRSLVARGQEPWKPFDPVEVPLLGYVVKWPKKPASVYTQSLIFVDALVLPTAIDLGYGVPITPDAKGVSRSSSSSGLSLSSVGELSNLTTTGHSQYRIDGYHKALVGCETKEFLYTVTEKGGATPGKIDLITLGKDDIKVGTTTECRKPEFEISTIPAPPQAATKPGDQNTPQKPSAQGTAPTHPNQGVTPPKASEESSPGLKQTTPSTRQGKPEEPNKAEPTTKPGPTSERYPAVIPADAGDSSSSEGSVPLLP